MAKRGRKPKPRGMRVIEGNAGKRDLPEDEIRPEGEPTPPESVVKNEDAMSIWDQYAPTLIELGVLTEIDSHMFGVWCNLMAEFEKYPAGFSASKISQLRALGSSFGMDASERARIPAKDKEKKDPAAEFFG